MISCSTMIIIFLVLSAISFIWERFFYTVDSIDDLPACTYKLEGEEYFAKVDDKKIGFLCFDNEWIGCTYKLEGKIIQVKDEKRICERYNRWGWKYEERSYEPEPEPVYAEPARQQPTAICKDGTRSYSDTRSGTCSGHGGVDYWY